MRNALHVDPGDAAPIWRQIEEGIRRLVVSRSLSPGAVIPSVRELARELQVNPATVSRAYRCLTDSGLLVVRRGEGTFVAEAPPAFDQAEQLRELRQGALRYATLSLACGVKENRAVEMLREVWRKLRVSGGGADDDQ